MREEIVKGANMGGVSRIVALHGFLGSPADFRVLLLPYFLAPNLFAIAPGPTQAWVRRFNQYSPDHSILLGYSMGGRIALALALAAPTKYRALIVLAANPGLPCESARYERRANDALWARRFLTLPWNEVIDLWNQQPVLRSTVERQLSEHSFCRKTLAQYLHYFSLGQQECLTAKINQLDLPILWLASIHEAQTVNGLAFKHRASQLHLIDGSHRFIFESPKLVAKHIAHFIRQ